MTAAEQRADQLRAIIGRLELLATSELAVVDAVIDGLARGRVHGVLDPRATPAERIAAWLDDIREGV